MWEKLREKFGWDLDLKDKSVTQGWTNERFNYPEWKAASCAGNPNAVVAMCPGAEKMKWKKAREFHITATYLCRMIRQQTGESYKEYLTGLRVRAAKEMLREEEASMADVCQRTGYTKVSHFIKVFQKSEGITPARYRDECRKGNVSEKDEKGQ
ncbi:helix-turn-helix domain-containing protein [Eisenbergiella sp.]